MGLIIVAIIVVVLLALVTVLVSARRRATTGTLSRETRQRDTAAGASAAAAEPGTELATVSAEARERADEAKAGGVATTGAKTPATYTPVDPEVLGETRRQFMNRGILTGMALALGALGAAVLGFLWPPNTGAAGFGGVINVGTISDIDDTITNKKQPYYNAAAKTYVVAYPKADLPNAAKVPAYKPILKGMAEGYVALYQRCVHLGCRVPFCQTSQWFECPCHGSKYNRVGEKQGGPAPRGLDRFVLTVSGGSMIVDTGNIIQGPPIGTNTTGQSPEGAPCV